MLAVHATSANAMVELMELGRATMEVATGRGLNIHLVIPWAINHLVSRLCVST